MSAKTKNLDYQQSLDWLEFRKRFKIRPGLKRISHLLELMGNPQNSFNSIHVAGTNGKGSTIAFMQAILSEMSLSVGCFTSPFIVNINESFSVDSIPVSDLELANLISEILPHVEEMDAQDEFRGITEFEVMTAIAFQFFANNGVDLAIIECGMGGRKDSTNVIVPDVAVITNIELEHCDFLGESVEEIAMNKAGIIKPGVSSVVGRLNAGAMSVVEAQAAKQASALIHAANELVPGEISLLVKYQRENAALAISAIKKYCEINDIELESSLIPRVLKIVFLPCRFEKVHDVPAIFLDSAHNLHAINELCANTNELFPGKTKKILFSCISTKDVQAMLKGLLKIHESKIYVTDFDDPRAQKFDEANLANANCKFCKWEEYIPQFIQQNSDEVLIICGSLYFVSQVRKKFFQD